MNKVQLSILALKFFVMRHSISKRNPLISGVYDTI